VQTRITYHFPQLSILVQTRLIYHFPHFYARSDTVYV
jgi:hypothetical protein